MAADDAAWPRLPIFGQEVEPDEEPEVEAEDDARRVVLITGAAGNIGRKLRRAWADQYEIVAIDLRRPDDDPEVIAADLSVWDESWTAYFDEVDAVVHLAGNPDEFATWEALEAPNLDALYNVAMAAALAGVERLVFASSNHAMGEYEHATHGTISEDLPPKPDGPYGGLKLAGERLGRTLSASTGLEFVALRIGWVQHEANRPETLPHAWARSIWLSDGDLVRLFTRAIEADLGDRPFVVANGLSSNRGTRWSLDVARSVLGYDPQDDAEAGG